MVAIIPLRKPINGRVTEKRLIGIAIAPTPSLETIAEHAKGTAWIENTVNRKLFGKIRASVMPKEASGRPLGILPATVEDYIVSSRGAFDMEGFNASASVVVKVLRQVLPTIDKRILRQCLESQAFADSIYAEKFTREDWLAVIAKMRAVAVNKNEDVACFDHWVATRDEVVNVVEGVDEFDVETALDALTAE